MELTVQEIIAKVALKKKTQLKQQHQKEILQNLNNPNHSSQRHFKNKSHTLTNLCQQFTQPTKTNTHHPQTLQLSNQSILTQKYKKLQLIYQKLKTKKQHQTKINQLYGQVIKQLQKVVKKNHKLQKQLNSIRSKKSSFNQKTNLIKSQHITNSQSIQKVTQSHNNFILSFPYNQKTNNNVLKSQKTNPKHTLLIKQVQENIETNYKDQPQNCPQQSQINNQNQQISQFTLQNHNPLNCWCLKQIHQYKLMINDKKAAILKLRTMLNKQQEIIKNYTHISSTQIFTKNQTSKININHKAKSVNQKCVKVEGTIVKLKRLKKSQYLQSYQNNTNKNLSNKQNINLNHHFYEQNMDQKTKKKYGMQLKTNSIQQKDENIDNSQFNQEYNVTKSPQIYVQQEQQNQTSEFICEI